MSKLSSTQVYDGIWGYNSLLSMAAVSCVFFPFSANSLLAGELLQYSNLLKSFKNEDARQTDYLAGTVNAVATVGIQAALRRNMDTV